MSSRYSSWKNTNGFKYPKTLSVDSYHGLLPVASRLAHSPLDRAVRVQALGRDIVLCSWARHLTLTVPLFTQVYKWVPANFMLGAALQWTSIPSRGRVGGVEVFLVASCYRNRRSTPAWWAIWLVCRLCQTLNERESTSDSWRTTDDFFKSLQPSWSVWSNKLSELTKSWYQYYESNE